MTYVGKILVIVILAFSLFFLALSTVVFTASTNWRTQYSELQKGNQDLQQQITATKNQLDEREQALSKDVQQREAQIESLIAERSNLEATIDELQNETTQARTALEVEQRTAQVAVEEAQAIAQEREVLRENLMAAQRQANEVTIQQIELNERIRELERALDTAQNNNRDLRESLADYRAYLDSRGLPSDPAEVRLAAGGVTVAPDIEGTVDRVNARADLIEVTIGTDDGVVVGQEYYVFRTNGTPEYVGRIRISSSEPDRSVARVIETYLGRKPREGDHVAAKIQPRS